MLNDVILIGVLEDIQFINIKEEDFKVLKVSYKVKFQDKTSSQIEVLVDKSVSNKVDSNVLLGTLCGIQGYLMKLKNNHTYLVAEQLKYFN